MEEFLIIQPTELLRPYVKQYWFLTIDNAECNSQRYIPSGYAILAFHRGDRIYSILYQEIQPRSSFCGQSNLYTDIIYSGNLNFITVVFQSVAARAVFGVPMNGLCNKNIDIELLEDSSLLDLEKRLMETGNNNQCSYLIEQYLLRKLCNFTSDRFNRIKMVVQSINDGQQDIAKLPQTACLGYKQFKRMFTDYTGLNPKEFIQIAWFRKALRSLHSSFNKLFLYYDVSPLNKVFTALHRFT